MRLVSAICLPEQAVERLSKLQLRLQTPKDGLRWTPSTQWHLTLGFYGECDAAQRAALGVALLSAGCAAISLEVEQLGLFPAKGILLAEITPTQALLQLHAKVAQAAGAAGLAMESRPFHPHITLARSKGAKAGQQTVARWRTAGLPAFGPHIHWTAQEIVLLESRLLSTGAAFYTHARIPLEALSTRTEEDVAL